MTTATNEVAMLFDGQVVLVEVKGILPAIGVDGAHHVHVPLVLAVAYAHHAQR